MIRLKNKARLTATVPRSDTSGSRAKGHFVKADFAYEADADSRHGPEELNAVAHALNTRPRKTLDWQIPAEALDQLLKQSIAEGVATTG